MTADEMFKELRYKYIERIYVSGNNIYDYLLKNEQTGEILKWIRLSDRKVIFMEGNKFNMQELQAINKKVEELGW